jgi:hypothetical protein
MTIFLDNMISPCFAEALRALEQDVCALREKFPPDTLDTVWLTKLGERGWPLITLDRRILSRPQELLALRQAGVTAFFLGPFFSKAAFWDQAVWLLRHWPKFRDVTAALVKGACFTVQQNGKMTPRQLH